MRKNYDFSTCDPESIREAPQESKLTIRFGRRDHQLLPGPLAREMALPYQTLMNMYLRDCAETRKRPHWGPNPFSGGLSQRSGRASPAAYRA